MTIALKSGHDNGIFSKTLARHLQNSSTDSNIPRFSIRFVGAARPRTAVGFNAIDLWEFSWA